MAGRVTTPWPIAGLGGVIRAGPRSGRERATAVAQHGRGGMIKRKSLILRRICTPHQLFGCPSFHVFKSSLDENSLPGPQGRGGVVIGHLDPVSDILVNVVRFFAGLFPIKAQVVNIPAAVTRNDARFCVLVSLAESGCRKSLVKSIRAELHS